jgi:hypothetical protein
VSQNLILQKNVDLYIAQAHDSAATPQVRPGIALYGAAITYEYIYKVRIHLWIYVCKNSYINTYINMYLHKNSYTEVYVYLHIYRHTYIYINIKKYIHVYIYVNITSSKRIICRIHNKFSAEKISLKYLRSSLYRKGSRIISVSSNNLKKYGEKGVSNI